MTIVQKALSAATLAFAIVAASAVAAEERLEVRFTWKIKGEYAGLYVAEAMGLFSQQGLKVSMKQGSGGQAAMAGLLQGQEDVVVAPGAYALSSVSKGMPIKIIALYHAATPLALFSHADRPIRVPKDLEGKKIATSFDTFTNYIDVFCKKTAIDCNAVTKVRVNNNMQQPLFMDRQVDAFGGYLDVDWPLLQASTPKPLVYIDLTKYGMIIPGLSIITSDAVIAKRPDALRRFLATVGRGTEMMRADIPKATDIILQSWNAAPSRTVVQEQIQSTADFISLTPNRPIGWIEKSVLTDALNILQESGQIDRPQPVENYYTNALLSE
jgi:NitT/TauT family transport system substrate-binding protein